MTLSLGPGAKARESTATDIAVLGGIAYLLLRASLRRPIIRPAPPPSRADQRGRSAGRPRDGRRKDPALRRRPRLRATDQPALVDGQIRGGSCTGSPMRCSSGSRRRNAGRKSARGRNNPPATTAEAAYINKLHRDEPQQKARLGALLVGLGRRLQGAAGPHRGPAVLTSILPVPTDQKHRLRVRELK